jgi:CubicO group peptidase (beta-lactamase class C family)
VTASREPTQLSRRTFLRHAAVATTATAITPFAFVRSARAAALDLERLVRRQMREAVTPGIAVAIVQGDEVVWTFGAGWADIEKGIRVDADTAFMLASVSKTVTCAGVMTLVEDGLLDLDLDANVNDYLPFEVRIPAAPNVAVTTRMLLTHTSAIRDRNTEWGRPNSHPTLYFHGDSPIALGDFLRSYLVPGESEYRKGANFYDRRPGKAYPYSNIAVALAGYVAEVVAHQDFDELCKERILLPLGMDQSGFRLADITTPNLAKPYRLDKETGAFEPFFQYGYPDYPDGALRTSAAHLARWLAAFMAFGALDGVRVLASSSVREIRPQPAPRHGLVAPGTDLVRRLTERLFPDRSHRGRLRRQHTDVLPPGHAGRRRLADELVPRLAAVERVPRDRPPDLRRLSLTAAPERFLSRHVGVTRSPHAVRRP